MSSPLVVDSEVVGAKYTPTASSEILPCACKFSVTVGTSLSPDTVPSVKSVGPILEEETGCLSIPKGRARRSTHPRIPSKPSKPVDLEATPIDCFVILSCEDSVTVSVNSVPENEPDPYDTETACPVLADVLDLTYSLPAPTQVFDEPVSIYIREGAQS